MQNKKTYKRPIVLSLAGFDPSGGAGVLADCKTFEQHRLIGMSVITANTIQTEDAFTSINWIDEAIVLEQLETILKNYEVSYVKIGMVPSISFLRKAIDLIFFNTKHPCVVWDPVLGSSTGMDFDLKLENFKLILPKLFLLTPNIPELKQLGGKEALTEVNLLIKGGHSEDPSQIGIDTLVLKTGKTYYLKPRNKRVAFAKHGSGCVFSSAVLANLSKGYPTIKAILNAKRYTEKYLAGNENLLGYHRF